MLLLSGFASKGQPVIVVTEHLSPYQIVHPDGSITGRNTAKVREIFQEAGLPYQIFSNEWTISYQQALKEKSVCIYSLARIPQRESKFTWIGKLSSMQAHFYSNPENNISLNNFDDAKNFRVAAIEDDVSLHFLKSKGFDEATNLYPVKNYESLLQLLEKRSKLIDLIMLNDELLHHRQRHQQNPIKLKKHDNFIAFSIDFYLACHADADPVLVNNLQNALEKVNTGN